MDPQLKDRIHRNCQKIFSDMDLKRKKQPYLIVTLIGAALVILGFKYRLSGDLVGGLAAATAGYLYWLYFSPYWHAQKVFKSIMLPQIVRSVNPDLKYSLTSTFSKSLLSGTQLLPLGFDNMKADDEFTGKIQHIQFGFRDISLTETKGSGKNKRTVQVFQGVIFDFTYPKKFSSHTVIHKDRVESVVGGYVAGLFQDFAQSVSTLKRVQLEHPDFEKQFQVLSTDQQDARFLITPKTMELIMAFTNEFGKDAHFCFYQNRFYIALDFPALHFDLKHPENLDDVISRVEQIWGMIQRVAEVLDLDNQSYKVV